MSSVAIADTLIIRPDGNGAYSDWREKNCDDNNHWQCVDESSLQTRDYLKKDRKPGKKDSFTFSSSGLTDETINSITLYYYAKRKKSDRYSIQPLVRANGNNYFGSVISLAKNYAYYSETFDVNPATGHPWSVSDVENFEAGMILPSSKPGGKVAQVYARIDYESAGQPDSCSDTDGGNNIFTLGTTSGYFNNNPYSNDDSCADTSNIVEYYCSGDYEQSQQQSCGTDTSVYICFGGDVYTNSTDYSCGSGVCSVDVSVTLKETCSFGCANGVCNPPPTTTTTSTTTSTSTILQDSCSETDEEFNQYVQGITFGYNGRVFFNNTDFCLDSATLREYYCSGSQPTQYDYGCYVNASETCVNGACVII